MGIGWRRLLFFFLIADQRGHIGPPEQETGKNQLVSFVLASLVFLPDVGKPTHWYAAVRLEHKVVEIDNRSLVVPCTEIQGVQNMFVIVNLHALCFRAMRIEMTH